MGNLVWIKKEKKKGVTPPILKPTYDQKPDTFLGPKMSLKEN